MCIEFSVGRGGRNAMSDVAAVQILLNQNRKLLPQPLPKALKVDGRIGTNTIERIEIFERAVMGLPNSDGLIAPDDATLRMMLGNLPKGPSKEKLAIVLPLALESKIDLYFPSLKASMVKYNITSPLQMAHFIAQVGHESASFLYSEEIASGAAYEGRKDLGNFKKGDGVLYKGRGLIQITGRFNYRDYSKFTGNKYLEQPELLSQNPDVAVDSACWFWVSRELPKLAEADDVKAVTKRINGGYNGLDDRIQNLRRAKALLAFETA